MATNTPSTALVIIPENYAERPVKEVPFVAASREDEAYLKTYFQRVEGAIIKTEDNPLQILADLHGHLTYALETVKDGKTASKFANHLFRVSLVRLVNAFIDRSYPVLECRRAAIQWFHAVLQTCIRCIINGYHPEDLVRCLEKLFTRSFAFYRLHGREDETNELRSTFLPNPQDTEESFVVVTEELFSELPANDNSSSYHFIDMVSTFGKLGGFDAILRRMSLIT